MAEPLTDSDLRSGAQTDLEKIERDMAALPEKGHSSQDDQGAHKLEEEAGQEKAKPAAVVTPIWLRDTDKDLPRHWVSGSMKLEDHQPLAEGGTAVIQTCYDKNLHRTIVIKTLHKDLHESELENKRFLREARVTAMIPHPGTVPVYELGRDRAGQLYFTMKKLDGRDLRKILLDISAKQQQVIQKFPLERMIDVLIQVGQTVGYAHAQGVIHRDLKPANILVGGFGEVTVIDWGLAKVRGEKETEIAEAPVGKKAVAMELTQPGKRFGTPLYMSPEQARADDVDERSDVYNLGIILFEMITAKNLIFGNDVDEIIAEILEQPTPIPSVVAPEKEIPGELEAICLKALAKDRDQRYASVKAFVKDLIHYRQGKDVSVYQYGFFEKLERSFTRNKLFFIAFGSAAVASVLTLLLVSMITYSK